MATSRALPEDGPARSRRRRPSIAIGPGMVVGLLATVALVVSMFMAWSASVHPSSIPAAFLWDRDATGDPSFLVYLVPLAVVLALGSLVPGGAGLRILGGLLTMVVVGVYGYQLHEVTESLGVGFRDTLESGVYVAGAAGIVGFVSGFLPTTLRSRRTVRAVDDPSV